MNRPLLAALALTLVLAGCGGFRESRLNPFNWFGGSDARQSTVAEGSIVVPQDPRPLVDQVTSMAVEQAPGGAIVRATGLPPTQGFWDGELVRVETADAEDPDPTVIVFDFRLAPPPYIARQGNPPSREVEVATFLTNNALDGVTRIVVRGARTERVSRR